MYLHFCSDYVFILTYLSTYSSGVSRAVEEGIMQKRNIVSVSFVNTRRTNAIQGVERDIFLLCAVYMPPDNSIVSSILLMSSDERTPLAEICWFG